MTKVLGREPAAIVALIEGVIAAPSPGAIVRELMKETEK